MFYLSNKKIKLFIISILLLIFCFILGIFNVKASSVDYVMNPDTLQYTYDDSGGTSHYENISSLNIKDMSIYDLFFFTTTDEYVSNNSPQLYWRIKSDIANSYGRLPYLVFIVYSPFKLYYPQPCLYFDNNSSSCSPTNHYEVVETKLNTEEDNYFYIVRTMDTGSANNFVTAYALEWSYSPSLTVVTNSNNYFISRLYVTATEQDAIELVTNYEDYFNNYAPDDPELPDNPLFSNYIDTSGWGSDIGGWGSSFDTSQATITDLVTMPITLLRAILNNLNSTCTTYTLGTLYNTSIILPCIILSHYLGNGLVTTIDLLLAGLIIFKIGKRFVSIFDDFTNLRDKQINELYGGGK